MSKSTNVVVISGNLTRDPELRTTTGGTSICTFDVAVNGREKVQGEWQDRPDYFTVTVFGATAENAANWLTKGAHVEVSGRLRQDRWQDEAGNKRSAVKVVADAIVFPPKGASGGQAQQETRQAWKPKEQAPGKVETGDDDIPFEW